MNKKYEHKSPIAIAVALVIAILGFIFNGTGFFEPESTAPNQVPSYNQQQATNSVESQLQQYTFRNEKALQGHFEKHKDEFEYINVSEYLEGANRVINDINALHKIEEEDGDDVYYLEATNELVIVSTDGYIRTYFKPTDGINYFKRT